MTAASRTAGTDSRQRILDFAQFDAETAQLDLVIEPAEEVNRSVGAIARQVSSLVKPSWAVRIRNEFLRGKFALPGIAAGYLHAPPI